MPTVGSGNMSGLVWSSLYGLTFAISGFVLGVWKPVEDAGCRKDQILALRLLSVAGASIILGLVPPSLCAALGFHL